MKTKADRQLVFDFSSRGLGKLPANLYTDRERLILSLWQNLLVKNVKYDKNKEGQYRTPMSETDVTKLVETINNDGLASADFVPESYERERELITTENGTKAWKYTGRNVKIPPKIAVTLKNGSTFTFLPEKLPELAYQIGGKEIFIKPKVQATGVLSPDNADLIAFLKIYASTDELRPAMTGACFDKTQNAVCATDGYKLVVVYGDNTHQVTKEGVFSVDGNAKAIDEKYPEYYNVIREKSKKFLIVDPKLLLKAVENVLPFANKTTKSISLLRVEGGLKIKAQDFDYNHSNSQYIVAEFRGEPFEEIGFNGKSLVQALKGIVKYAKDKNKPIQIDFERVSKAAQITFESVFGRTMVLLMPVHLHYFDENGKETSYPTDPEEYKPTEEKNVVNKTLALKIAVAKAKIKIALAL